VSDPYFEKNLPLLNDVVELCQRWPSPVISEDEIASRLGRSVGAITKLLEHLGVTPVRWEEPEDYAVADVIEAGTRHEVSARVNPVNGTGVTFRD
jgi:hypothetical protein